jgi:hypothetical protein
MEKHMTFKPGQSGNPAGRPKGVRGKAEIFAEALLEGETEEIIRAAVKAAKAGELGAIRLCLDRLVPRRRDRAVPFDLPPLHSAASALSALADIAAAVSRGDMTPAEADNVSRLLERYLSALQHVDVEQRLSKLEGEGGPFGGNSHQNGHRGRKEGGSQDDEFGQRAKGGPLDPDYNFGDAP